MKTVRITATALLAFALAAAPASAATTRTVGCLEDRATFPTINAAIAASSSGDSVKVCPGIYRENVVVPSTVDDLTIFSEQKGAAKVVPGNPVAPGFLLNSSFNKIKGFSISGFSEGIFVIGPNGNERIENNIIFDNVDGVSFQNSGGNVVSENVIVDNNAEGVFDFFSIAVAADQKNTYTDNKVLYNGANGIHVNTMAGLPSEKRAEIRDNVINNNTVDGVLLINSSRVTVTGCEVSFNGFDGIELIGSSKNRITENRANKNGSSPANCGPLGNCTGIRAHNTSINNTFERNKADDNRVWDAQDETTGSGTAGTANTWIKNRCEKQSPEGICDEQQSRG